MIKLSLIDKENKIIETYSNEKSNCSKEELIAIIKQQPEYREDYIIVDSEGWHSKGINIKRFYNGKLLSNKEAIDKGLIELKENEYLFKSDYIGVVEKTQKVIINENNEEEVAEKSMEEKYIEGIINDNEYNQYIIQSRLRLYNTDIDILFLEFLQKYINEIKSTMSKELQKDFENIISRKLEIKRELMKTTDKDFKQSLERKLNIENNNINTFEEKEGKNG